MIRRFLGVLAGFELVVASACYNVSSYQTAEALKKGEMAAGTGIGFTAFPASKTTTSKDEEASDTPDNQVVLLTWPLPYHDYFFRVGAGSGLDLGIKYSVPTAITADLKFQFLDLGGFDMAIDPGLVFGSLIFLHRVGADLPLLVSLRFTDTLGLYGGVRVQYWYWMCSASKECDADVREGLNSFVVGGFAGVTVDVQLDSELYLFVRPEVHYYRIIFTGVKNQFNIVQPGIAVGLKFGGAPKPKRLPPPSPAPAPAPPPAPAPAAPGQVPGAIPPAGAPAPQPQPQPQPQPPTSGGF